MAPSATTSKARENNFFDIGVQGRKTGITLKDSGARDENGLELIDGIFSSPERSTPKYRSGQNNTTISEDAEMDLGQSTIPEPTEVLSQRSNARQSILPPPRARSPIKTTLNSPARRHSSLGPISSPQRFSKGTPRDTAAAEPVNRRLDFSIMSRTSADDPPSSAARPATKSAPGRSRKMLSSYPEFQASSALKRSKAISVAEDDDDEDDEEENEEIAVVDGEQEEGEDEEVEEEEEVEDVAQQDDSGYVNGQGDESVVPNGNNNDDEEEEEEEEEEEDDEDDNSNEAAEPSIEEEEVVQVEEESDPPPKKPARGRPPKKQKVDHRPVLHVQASSQQAPKKKGRPTKAKTNPPKEPTPEQEPVEEEAPEEEAPEQVEQQAEKARPAKRGRKARRAPVEESSLESSKLSSQSSKPRVRKPPPSQRDPNARISSAKKPKSTKPEASSTAQKRRGSSTQPQPQQVVHHEPPSEDSGVQTTRFGRKCVKPLAFWRNERIVYGQAESQTKERHYLPAITEIIRTEDVDQPAPRRAKPKPRANGSAKAGRKRKAREVEEDESEDEEGDELEDWERGDGVITGGIRRWDSVTGGPLEGDEDEEETSELAYASSAIETREVANTTFRYAKTLTLPFFGSGMVDLPPAGVKKMKNSRKMQMVFFVFYGHVQVKVANNIFGISKGGMWQVPRGNFYSIANLTTRPARIFFAQGCEVPLGQTEQLLDQQSQQAGENIPVHPMDTSMAEGESRLG